MSSKTLSWALSSWLVLSLAGYAAAQPTPRDQQDPREEIQKEIDRIQKELDRVFNDVFDVNPRIHFGPGLEWAGMRLERVDRLVQEQLGLPGKEGLAIVAVSPGSAAEKAGVKRSDLLVKINGAAVPSDHDAFAKLVKEQKADAAMELGVLRNGKEQSLKAENMPLAVTKNAGRPALMFPRMPEFPRIDLQLPANLGDFDGTRMEYSRNGDEFSGKYVKDELTITVKGNFEEGRARPSEITIRDGAESKTYSEIKDVPEQHRNIVRRLMQPNFNNRLAFPRLRGLRDFE